MIRASMTSLNVHKTIFNPQCAVLSSQNDGFYNDHEHFTMNAVSSKLTIHTYSFADISLLRCNNDPKSPRNDRNELNKLKLISNSRNRRYAELFNTLNVVRSLRGRSTAAKFYQRSKQRCDVAAFTYGRVWLRRCYDAAGWWRMENKATAEEVRGGEIS